MFDKFDSHKRNQLLMLNIPKILGNHADLYFVQMIIGFSLIFIKKLLELPKSAKIHDEKFI